MSRVSVKNAVVATTIVVFLSGFGFSNTRLHEAIIEFDAATTSSIGSVREYYAGINDFFRWSYLEEARLTKDMEIGDVKAGKPTGLATTIDPEYIQARVDLIDALIDYTNGLANLASSNAPDKAAEAMTTIGQKVGSIGNKIQTMSSSNRAKIDVEKYSQPITRLASILTRAGMNWKRDKDLKAAVLAAEPRVSEICDLLHKDLGFVGPALYDPKLNQLFSLYIQYYNNHLTTSGDPAKDLSPARQQFVSDMQNLQTRRLALSVAAPQKVVAKLKEAHSSIAAQISNKKLNIDNLIADLKDFTSTAKDVSSSVQDIRKAFNN